MNKCIIFLLFLFAFTFAKSQTNTDSISPSKIDSMSRSILTIPPQMIYPEKIYKKQENDTNKVIQEYVCDESEITEAPAIRHEKTNQDRITQYKKMIEVLRGEKNKLESKGQNTNEIDRKIEKLQTLILNLSK